MATRGAGRDFLRETEFFGVPPTDYLDNIVNAVYDHTADALDAVEDLLKERPALKGKEKDIEKASVPSAVQSTNLIVRLLTRRSRSLREILMKTLTNLNFMS